MFGVLLNLTDVKEKNNNIISSHINQQPDEFSTIPKTFSMASFCLSLLAI